MISIRSLRPAIGSAIRCLRILPNRIQAFSDHTISKFNYVVLPQPFSEIKRSFPPDIQLPVYSENGLNDDHLFEANIIDYSDLSRGDQVIDGVRNACQIAKQILNNTGNYIKPGMTGEQIDEFVYQQCLKYGCYPSPLNYNEFPKCVTLCANNVVVHSIPDQRQIQISDILTVDVSVFYKGAHGDTAKTFLIAKDRAIDYNELTNDLCSNLIKSNVIDEKGLKLIRTAKDCLDKAIAICKEGVHLNEIGHTIQQIANDNGFNVVPAVCGHSIGEYLHGLPHLVFCPYDEYTENDVLLNNMLITIEPVICEGEPDVELLEDGWTVCTADNGRAAQFEHTILVKQTHSEILT